MSACVAKPFVPRSRSLRFRAVCLSGDTAGVGYDPYRKHRTTRVDYVLVAAATSVALALLVWALWG